MSLPNQSELFRGTRTAVETSTRLARHLRVMSMYGSLACVLAVSASAQTPVTVPESPSCATTLDSLDAKIRGNYAGFLLEIRGPRKVLYDSVKASHVRDARGRSLSECFPVLNAHVQWFNDPHLFVYQAPIIDSVVAMERQQSVRHFAVREPDIRRELLLRGRGMDPIEGIWYDGPIRYGVIRDPENAKKFVAVLLTADSAAWPVGAVRAEFVKQPDGSYATTMTARNFSQAQLTAHIYRRTILRFSPGMWGKAFPVAVADTGLLDTTNVHKPRVVVRTRSVVVSVPSHDPQYARELGQMIRAVDTLIRQRGLLIVDLRGNEGGSSAMTRALDPYITTTVRRPTPFDSGDAVMLSSPAQIAYAKRFTGTDTTAFVRDLVARMEAHPGELVSLETKPSSPPWEAVFDGDWKVVVLVDHGTVSASEVLVLRALRSTRAVVVGEATAGALDYQSTQIVGLRTGDSRWALGYPTITAHKDLPSRGMRGKGIAPTVRMDFRRVTDPIAESEERYGRPQ